MFVVVPLLAWAGGLFLRWAAFVELQRDWSSRGLPPPSGGRFALFSGYGVVPAVLGIVLWFLSRPIAGAIDAEAVPSAVALGLSVLWAGIAYSAASCAAVASQTLLLRARFPGAFSQDMGRILTLYATPLTAVVFAVVLNLLLFGFVSSALAGRATASAAAVDSVVRAFAAFALGTLAFPVAAAVSNRIRDMSGRGFLRILLIFEVGELPVVLGLIMGLLAIGSL